MRTATKSIRQIAIFTAGITVLMLGIILLVFPGPGLLLMLLGLLILSVEFPQAQKYIEKIKRRLKR